LRDIRFLAVSQTKGALHVCYAMSFTNEDTLEINSIFSGRDELSWSTYIKNVPKAKNSSIETRLL